MLQAKRDTPTIGSWNILEEIQRVRSKATEELLRTLPSKRIDWSSFALEKKNDPNTLISEKKETDMADKMHDFSESINASLHVASHGFQGMFSYSLGVKLLVYSCIHWYL